ncbi:MAG: response regulator, partial [Spirochaetales bacterium]|nr:response regulator [Spirochaetales bacterium]
SVNYANLYRYIEKPWSRVDLALTVKEALRSFYQDKHLEIKTREIEEQNAVLKRKIKELKNTRIEKEKINRQLRCLQNDQMNNLMIRRVLHSLVNMLQIKLINAGKETLLLKKIETYFMQLQEILKENSQAGEIFAHIHALIFSELFNYRKIIGFTIHDAMASYVRAVQRSLKGETVQYTEKTTYVSSVFRVVKEKYSGILDDKDNNLVIDFSLEMDTPDVGIKILDIYLINIFENLLTNSIRKVSKNEGEKWIKITIREKKIGDNPFTIIYWTDNGPGVEQSRKKIIFEGDSDKTEEGDHGIGLSDIKMTVEALGGFIKETGIFGEGARFIMGLPKIEEEDDEEGRPDPESGAHQLEFDPQVKNKKILVVDDDKEIVAAYEDFFSHAGIKDINHAYDGKTALELLSRGDYVPDLLITDIDMKMLDGYGLIKGLAALGNDIPVLVVSGTLRGENEDAVDKVAALYKLGIKDTIDKPIDFQVLFDKTQEILLQKNQ